MSPDDLRPDRLEGGVTRRRFLAGLGVAATAAAGGAYGLTVWRRDGTSPEGRGGRAKRAPLAPGDLGRVAPGRTLVIVELRGGNDGLDTVVPHANGTYRDLRPTLGVADPLDLDGEIGLHPKLAKLAQRYRAGQVAIVEGVGYPKPDLSHFASLATWWSARVGGAAGSGWLGRYLDGTVGFDDPLAGLSIGPGPSPALVGERSFSTSIADSTGLQPSLPAWLAADPDEVLAAWVGLAPERIDPTTTAGQVREAIILTGKARTQLAGALASVRPGAAPGSAFGRSRPTVADSLGLAAELVVAKQAPRVISVHGIGDFDTHEGQAQRHPQLLEQLDTGIERFFSTLDGAGASQRAVLMTTSEFGRRPAENGSGTDHGTANAHFVIGAAVKGGRYGTPPDLRRLDGSGNLLHAVDFRSLYATVLHGWLGVDPDPVLGGTFEELQIV